MIRASILSVAIFTVILGSGYPLVVTGIANLLWPIEAKGSIVRVDGKLVGSTLIGQDFSSSGYFVGRPSATSPKPYTSFDKVALTGSTGSNLGPLNEKQSTAVSERYQQLKARFGAQQPIPNDLLTASGSGLDPHISPAAAVYQLPTIAKERGVDPSRIETLISQHTEKRAFGLLGEPRVNVLALNLALDELGNRP